MCYMLTYIIDAPPEMKEVFRSEPFKDKPSAMSRGEALLGSEQIQDVKLWKLCGEAKAKHTVEWIGTGE